MELNKVRRNDANLLEGPEVFDNTAIKIMKYYQNKDGVYYYLDMYGRFYAN